MCSVGLGEEGGRVVAVTVNHMISVSPRAQRGRKRTRTSGSIGRCIQTTVGGLGKGGEGCAVAGQRLKLEPTGWNILRGSGAGTGVGV